MIELAPYIRCERVIWDLSIWINLTTLINSKNLYRSDVWVKSTVQIWRHQFDFCFQLIVRGATLLVWKTVNSQTLENKTVNNFLYKPSKQWESFKYPSQFPTKVDIMFVIINNATDINLRIIFLKSKVHTKLQSS